MSIDKLISHLESKMFCVERKEMHHDLQYLMVCDNKDIYDVILQIEKEDTIIIIVDSSMIPETAPLTKRLEAVLLDIDTVTYTVNIEIFREHVFREIEGLPVHTT